VEPRSITTGPTVAAIAQSCERFTDLTRGVVAAGSSTPGTTPAALTDWPIADPLRFAVAEISGIAFSGHIRVAVARPFTTTDRAGAAVEWCTASRLDRAEYTAAAATPIPTRMRCAVAIVPELALPFRVLIQLLDLQSQTSDLHKMLPGL